jgi:hypothetical protein
MFTNSISENRAAYGIMWKNAVQPYRLQLATIVMPPRLNITLNLHCLSYRNYKRENERNSFDFIIIRTSSVALDGPLFFSKYFSQFFERWLSYSVPNIKMFQVG